MNIVKSWRKVHLYDIFSVSRGNKLDRGKMTDGNIAFIGRTANANGISARVSYVRNHEKYGTVEPYDAGCLTLALGGSIGSCFYQNEPFYTSQNVAVLSPMHEKSEYALLFVASVISTTVQNSGYEAFVEELNKHIMTDFNIMLPVTSSGGPDWTYMEQYMQAVMDKQAHVIESLTRISKEKHPVPMKSWGGFRVGKLFRIEHSKVYHTRQLEEMESGLAYVTRGQFNNGLKCYVQDSDKLVHNPAGVISFGAEGSAFFYQPDEYISGRDMYYLDTRGLSEMTCLFLVSCLSVIAGKYSYTNGMFPNKIANDIIKLPVTPSGEPDWSYMDDYMRQVMDRQEYVVSCLKKIHTGHRPAC